MKHSNPHKPSQLNLDNCLDILSIILFLIGIVYLAKGFYNLTLDQNEGARDLMERWQEQQYIYHRQYPYYARQGSENIIPEIGSIGSGGYFPWSFFTGFFLIPKISWEATRFYHAFLNLLSLVILGLFSYHIGLPYGRSKALFSLAASLAVSSNCTTLNNGQYGLIINALLIIFFEGIKRYKHGWTGLILGLAMVKPNISALYFFILIIYRRFQTISSFLIYIIGGSIFVAWIVRTSPFKMIGEIFQQSNYFAGRGNSAVNYFIKFGLSPSAAVLVLGGSAILITLIIFYFCRSYSLLTLFAIASVMGRIATYHKFYDNVMVIFLLLAVLKMTWIKPHKFNFIILLLVGLSLWLPAKIIQFKADYGTAIQFIIWLFALGYLLFQEKKINAHSDARL